MQQQNDAGWSSTLVVCARLSVLKLSIVSSFRLVQRLGFKALRMRFVWSDRLYLGTDFWINHGSASMRFYHPFFYEKHLHVR